MTKTDPFVVPSDVKGAKTYQLPGDFERSTYNDKPYVVDREGKRRMYTRFTTFIDCLSDRTMLEKWKQRMILTGLAVDHHYYANLDISDSDTTLFQQLINSDWDDRKELNRIAEDGFTAGDGYLKAQQGTDMHSITEAWDRGEVTPPMGDREVKDFVAWLELIDHHDLRPVDIERKCVLDEYRTAGTPDRTYWWRNRLVIGDLKTGQSVEYDPGKMAMQLALAAHGEWYDPYTFERFETGVSKEVGLILHVPNGAGSAALYAADLTEGWRGIQLAGSVRGWRNTSKKLLVPVLD